MSHTSPGEMLRLNKDPPKRVVVESDGGNLIAIGLGKKAILVAVSSEGVRIATANS